MAENQTAVGSQGQPRSTKPASASSEQPQAPSRLLPFNFGSFRRSRVSSAASATSLASETTTATASPRHPPSIDPRRCSQTDTSSIDSTSFSVRSRPSIAKLRSVTSYTRPAPLVAPKLSTSLSEPVDGLPHVSSYDSPAPTRRPSLLSPPTSRSRRPSDPAHSPTSPASPLSPTLPIPSPSSSSAEEALISHLRRQKLKDRANAKGKGRVEEEVPEEIRLVDRPSRQGSTSQSSPIVVSDHNPGNMETEEKAGLVGESRVAIAVERPQEQQDAAGNNSSPSLVEAPTASKEHQTRSAAAAEAVPGGLPEASARSSTDSQPPEASKAADSTKDEDGGGGTLSRLGNWALRAYYGTDLSTDKGEGSRPAVTSGEAAKHAMEVDESVEPISTGGEAEPRSMSENANTADAPARSQEAAGNEASASVGAPVPQSFANAQEPSLALAPRATEPDESSTYNYWWSTISRGSKRPPPIQKPAGAKTEPPPATTAAAPADESIAATQDVQGDGAPASGWTSYVASWMPLPAATSRIAAAPPASQSQAQTSYAGPPGPPSSSSSVAGSAPSASAMNAAGWLLSQAQGIRRPSQASGRDSLDDTRSEGKRPRSSGELEEASGDLLRSARAIKRASQGLPSAPAAGTPPTRSFLTPSTPPPPRPAPRRNLVVPSFDYTFKRPPRAEPAVASTRAQDTALPKSHTGWSTLGFLSASKPVVEPITSKNTEPESTHGLPRLAIEGADAWKHVKRVVIVGVHGWYPNAHIQK